MAVEKQGGFFAFLNRLYTAHVAPIIALMSFVFGAIGPVGQHWPWVKTALPVAGSIVLVAYNIWISRVKRRSVIDGRLTLRYRYRFRLLIHIFSASLLVISWAVLIYVTSPKLQSQRGMRSFHKADYKSASAAFGYAARKAKTEHLYYYWEAKARLFWHLQDPNNPRLEEIARARSAIEQAKLLKPGNSDVLCCSGRIFIEDSNMLAGLRELEKSIDSNDHNTEAYNWSLVCSYNLAFEEENLDVKIQLLQDALMVARSGIEIAQARKDAPTRDKIRNWDAFHRNALAYAYLERGENISRVRVLIEDALREYPGHPYLLDTYAWLIVLEAEHSSSRLTEPEMRSRYEQSRSILLNALSRFQYHKPILRKHYAAIADVLYHLGHVEVALKNRTEAEKRFHECLGYKEGHKKALEGLARLEGTENTR